MACYLFQAMFPLALFYDLTYDLIESFKDDQVLQGGISMIHHTPYSKESPLLVRNYRNSNRMALLLRVTLVRYEGLRSKDVRGTTRLSSVCVG